MCRPFRQKLSKEEIPEMRRSIRELEADWDKRWSETLKETPLVSFLKEDPVSGASVSAFCFQTTAVSKIKLRRGHSVRRVRLVSFPVAPESCLVRHVSSKRRSVP